MNALNASARLDLPDSRPYCLRLVMPGTQSIGWFGKVTLRIVFYITLAVWLLTAFCQILAVIGMTVEEPIDGSAILGLLTLSLLAAWLLGVSMATALGGSPATFPWSAVHHLSIVAVQVAVLYGYAALAGGYAQVAMDVYDENYSAVWIPIQLLSPAVLLLWASIMAFLLYPLLIGWNIVFTLSTWPIAFFFWLRPYLAKPRHAVRDH